MKTAEIFLRKTGCVIIALISSTAFLFAQDEQTPTTTKNLIESQRYIFKAERVSPTTGRTRELTPEYYLKVNKDSVIADLPYFGRAYSAPANLAGGGINFTSVKFNYHSTQDKKNRWQITINPKDASDVQEMTLTIFENGKADLNVTSNNRQPIHFYGYISEK